jgi:hypothetical protein
MWDTPNDHSRGHSRTLVQTTILVVAYLTTIHAETHVLSRELGLSAEAADDGRVRAPGLLVNKAN